MYKSSRVGASEVSRRMELFKAAAREKGIRLTPQRLEIFEELASSLEHPNAEAVYRKVHARMPTVSLDTVYRTLKMLNDAMIVSTLDASLESVRFDANPDKHHHFVCVKCGLARDFTSADLDDLRLPESLFELGSVLCARVEVRGLCRACARVKSKPGPGNRGKDRRPSR